MRPLAGYTLHDHKTNAFIRRELNITDWTGIYTCKEYQKTEPPWNHTTTDHEEGERMEDRRNVGENSCNSLDGTDQTGPSRDVYDDDDDDV